MKLYLSAILFLLSFPLKANFCKDEGDARGRAEAIELEDETFSQPITGDNVNQNFNRDYNARLITCNRKRDNKGNKIENEIQSDHTFDNNLEPRTIKGKYKYLSLANLKYAYQLERVSGTWIVTVSIQFFWPSRKSDMVDLPIDLVRSLNLDSPDNVCSTTVVDNPEKNKTTIKSGFIDDRSGSGSNIKKIDQAYYYGDTACRVRRDLVVGDKTVLNHLRDYWRSSITSIWNRPGFEINPVFIGCEPTPSGQTNSCDAPSSADISAWEKDNIIWKVRFNLKPNHRPSFKRWTFKWNHMHTGTTDSVIAHELGHYLGLDDEYGESNISKKECENILSSAPDNYLMCDSDSARAGAQGVYAWIITRRYGIAKTPQCKSDTDCAGNEFCDKGTASIGRNECIAKRDRGQVCSRNNQCFGNLTCNGSPIGKCGFDSTLVIGQACNKNGECASGSCNKNGICQCTSDSQCANNQYCKKGTIGIGINSCETLKSEGDSCSKDSQCGGDMKCQGKPIGKCVLESSVALGGSCIKNSQCTTGSCNKDGRCQCKVNSDCPSGN